MGTIVMNLVTPKVGAKHELVQQACKWREMVLCHQSSCVYVYDSILFLVFGMDEKTSFFGWGSQSVLFFIQLKRKTFQPHLKKFSISTWESILSKNRHFFQEMIFKIGLACLSVLSLVLSRPQSAYEQVRKVVLTRKVLFTLWQLSL